MGDAPLKLLQRLASVPYKKWHKLESGEIVRFYVGLAGRAKVRCRLYGFPTFVIGRYICTFPCAIKVNVP
jgi:hypothetical protein